MPFTPDIFIAAGAIAVMFYCLWLVVSLRSEVPGGIIGARWNALTWMIASFSIGYLVTPFASKLPAHLTTTIIPAIFLFGALYVLVTIKLIHRIIIELTS